jgi:alpha-beta hydrolase superfamily lysophospholipase
MIIFSDENLEVIHRSGSSPYLLVTFNEMEMRANGSRFWGQRLCEKAGISALGFISRRPNWFPAASVVKAVEAAAPILHATSERILYGHSQGGYAALRYRRRFNATVAVAFCPQVSIDPKAVPFDGRFARHFSPDLHANMGIAPDHAAGRAYLFFDPFHTVDHQHAVRITALQERDPTGACPYDRSWHRSRLYRDGARAVADRGLPRRRSSGSARSRPRSARDRANAAPIRSP